jgi:hypothetical protein
MTAKDKAKELVDRFRIGDRNMKSKAKQCALICVDEIINTYPTPWSSLDIDPQKEYWQEVEQEINKL